MPEGVKQRSVRGSVVQQVARYIRNRECPKGVNNVSYVVWSCNKLHATYEIVNYVSRLIIRATSCTRREVNIRIAYGFYSQALAGDNQKLFH